jgi:mannose-6-phosphate isomerase-like protein (cupin superfamily)
MIEAINLAGKLSLIDDHWNPRVVAELNGQQVRLAKIEGEFVWHSHEREDELFMVLEGELRMEFRDRVVLLRKGEILVVPAGVEHRPVAEREVHLLLFEPATTINTGDVVDSRTRRDLSHI